MESFDVLKPQQARKDALLAARAAKTAATATPTKAVESPISANGAGHESMTPTQRRIAELKAKRAALASAATPTASTSEASLPQTPVESKYQTVNLEQASDPVAPTAENAPEQASDPVASTAANARQARLAEVGRKLLPSSTELN